MGYPIYHSAYTAAQIEAAIGKGPRVNASGYWEVWNVSTGVYESTGVGAGVNPPTVVTQVSQMTNHGYVYIYNGSEDGYTPGYWYYWSGTAWTAGGAYQSAPVDPTLSVAGAAADAKACGDLKSAFQKSFYTTHQGDRRAYIQGGITIYGEGNANTNRCRCRIADIDTGALVHITIAAGYAITGRAYTQNALNPTYFAGIPFGWTTGSVDFVPVVGYTYYVVIKRDDDADISPETLPVDLLTTTVYENVTDTDLVDEGVPADAKVTGEYIHAALGLHQIIHESPKGYSQGSISTSTGGNISSNNRVRALGYFQFPNGGIVRIKIANGFKWSGRRYTGNPISSQQATQVYEGYFPDGEIATFVTGDWQFIADGAMYYRFVLAREDDAVIEPSDIPSNAITFECYASRAANEPCGYTLRGNVSIRAAKTYTFNDGTPPVIDWYLLQGVDNRFYRSKDLTTKDYLFTFNAPTSTTSNWSCGIDKNDNVIFVKDAAGYTDDDGPRLDDAKRVNPIYFLASERYAVIHEMDFGSALKPAGWLTNVGWCMLPNGDIVFCEYTRGTLATCNVWHITGDITDPSNWVCEWSHAIVDSTSGSEPEMKHCHCVQYDFFTGICYFSTGDGSNSSYVYYSVDNGDTWNLAYGPNRDRCRQLSFVFTPNKVYWASDSYQAADKHFFIADRDINGVIDIANAVSIPLPAINTQSCYGCVYLAEYNLIVMMDRDDNPTTEPLILKGFDITTNAVVTIASIPSVGSSYVGFRTKYINWYPTGNCIGVGFNPQSGWVTPDTNTMAVCGNQGGTTGDGSIRINNLLMYISKIGGDYSVRFGTIPLK